MENTVAVDRIGELVVSTLRDLADQGVVDIGGADPDGDMRLFGADGVLDSIGLVSLVVAVEERLVAEGIDVALADERALSQRNSPYRSVASLAAYAADLVPAS